MKATAAPPPEDGVSVDPVHAAALADTLRAVFDYLAASATLPVRGHGPSSLTFELCLAPGVLLVGRRSRMAQLCAAEVECFYKVYLLFSYNQQSPE